jgi:hypothetical protein
LEPEKAASSPSQRLLGPLALLGILAVVSWFRPKTSIQESIDTTRKSPVRVVIESFPPTLRPSERRATENRKGAGRQWFERVIQLLTLIAVTAYAYVAERQWTEMKTANELTGGALDLNKKLVKGTFAAVIIPDIGFDANDSTVNVVLANHGKAITNTWARYEIVQESLPDERPVRFHRQYDVADSVVREGDAPNHYYVIDGFTKQDLDLYRASQEGIKVNGTFRYDDGFGEIITKDFCMITTAFGRFPCDGLARYIHSLPHTSRSLVPKRPTGGPRM